MSKYNYYHAALAATFIPFMSSRRRPGSSLSSIALRPGLPVPLVVGPLPLIISAVPVRVVKKIKITLTTKTFINHALVKVVKVVKANSNISHMRARARVYIILSFCYLFLTIIKSALTALTTLYFSSTYALTAFFDHLDHLDHEDFR